MSKREDAAGRVGPLAWSGFFPKGLVLVLGCVLFAGLGSSRLFDRDEPRNARCTDEMLAAGDWVVPLFNGELRTHKPIMIYWLEGISFSILGSNAWGARIPSALLGLVTLGLVYLLAKAMTNRERAYWTVAVLGTSTMFVVAARVATPDAPLIAGSTAAVCFLVLSALRRLNQLPSAVSHNPASAGMMDDSQVGLTSYLRRSGYRRWLLLGYAAMGFAMLSKGPVGMVMPSIVAGLWLWMELSLLGGKSWWIVDWRAGWRAFCWLEPWWGIPCALLIAAPWYIWVGVRTDGAWLRGFFFEHNLGRAMQAMEGHRGGVTYYPMAMLIGVFPWSMVLLPIVLWVRSQFWNREVQSNFAKDHRQLDAWVAADANEKSKRCCRLGLIWISVYLLVFSLASTKLPSYITPCYCGVALLIGGCADDWSAGRFRVGRWLVHCIACVHTIVGLLATATIVYLDWYEPMDGLRWAGLWTMSFVIAAIFVWWTSLRKEQFWIVRFIFLSGAMFLVGMFAHGAVVADSYRSDLNSLLRFKKDQEGNAYHWMAVGTIESSWVYYLGAPIREIAPSDSDQGDWIAVANEFLGEPGSLMIIGEKDWGRLLPRLRQDRSYEIIADGIRFRPGKSFQELSKRLRGKPRESKPNEASSSNERPNLFLVVRSKTDSKE